MVRGQIRPYLVQEPLPSVAVPGGVHEQIEVPNYEGRIALSSGDVMHPVRHLFWSTCLAAAIGVVLETDATGGLVTMSLAAAVAAVVAMGYGFAYLEDLHVEEGRVTAANLGDYKLPSQRDVPPVRIVLVPGGAGVGPENVKAIAELANVPVAAAIANAVHDAVGVRLHRLPLSAEQLWAEMQAQAASPAG